MNGEGRQHQEKRSFTILSDEVDTQVRLKIRSVLNRSRFQIGSALHSISAKKMRSSDHRRKIVSLPVWLKLPTGAQMALAYVACRITRRLQSLGNRHYFKR